MNDSFVTCFDSIATLPDSVDVIFVVNQDITPQQILSVVNNHHIDRLIVVSTHAPFPDEHRKFQALLEPARLWWLPMSWLLSDAEMEDCDDRAVGELAVGNAPIDMSAYYKRSRYLRNEQAAISLAQHVSWNFCYATDGIGVVYKAWPNAITLRDSPHHLKAPMQFHYSLFSRIAVRLNELCYRPQIQIVEDEFECYAFLGNTHRLRFRPGVCVRTLESTFVRSLLNRSEISELKSLVTRAAALSVGKSFYVATTVHNFSPWMIDSFPELRVFVDGLHSANYPISYGAGYRGTLIVSREDCDRQWFEKCGCTVLPPPKILARERDYDDPCRPRPINNVCLMLNHAGDWSALIDRSDTDFVVMVFVEAAVKMPQLTFRVRPHPTMAMIEHEGVASYERLRKWIVDLKLLNLEFSNLSFEKDFAWTDCCVSEYSNVLVDCMKADKACVALNPTNRRNFLEHLEPLGLRTVHNCNELVGFLNAMNES